MTEPSEGLPLADIRVLDLSRVLAGPVSAMALGDLGADVIKVEHPDGGDDTRQWGAKVGDDNTSYYNCANRNKQSICLNLGTEHGQRIARDLASRSDVVVQNFRTGGAEKLGLGYEDLKAINPRLVYCSVSGYDRDGPEARRPGYDLVVQGEAGLMALSGAPDSGPLRLGIAAADLFTGLYATQAILAALLERQRSGRGRHVQLALYDSGLTITSYLGLETLARQADPPKFGNGHPLIVPYGVFDAADGPIVITVGNDAQFERFCRHVIDRPDVLGDPRFRSNALRSTHRAQLLLEVQTELGRRPRADILTRLKSADIPGGEVLGMLEALQSDRARQAGMLVDGQHAQDGCDVVLAPPYKLDGKRLPVRRMPPRLVSTPMRSCETCLAWVPTTSRRWPARALSEPVDFTRRLAAVCYSAQLIDALVSHITRRQTWQKERPFRPQPARGALMGVLASLVLACAAHAATAAGWPDKPIRLIVPFPPGGPTDTVSRIVGQDLSRRLGQPVVVENRSGASGAIGAAAVANAPADGYTLMMLATPPLVAPRLSPNAGYSITKDFAALCKVYDLPVVVVINPAMLPKVHTLQDLIAETRKSPLLYTTSGAGTVGHLTIELLKAQGSFDMQHVPYRGGAPAMQGLLSGEVPMMYADMVVALPHVKTGRLRAIAVGAKTDLLPEVKTIAEQGFAGFDSIPWGGLLAPAGTPRPIVERISQEVKAVLADKSIQDRLMNAGALASHEGPDQLAERIRRDDDKWGRVIRERGITAQ